MKSYREFLNEDLKKSDKIEYDTISDMIEDYLDENGIGVSFNDGYYNHDGDKDLNGLKKYLDDNLSTKNTLDYFFSKYKDTIFSDEYFISKNGFYDYMLYTYDNLFPLNGVGIGTEPEDKLLKYFYGFQTTKLGRIFIMQNFNSFEDFYKACAENFTQYFFEQVSDINYDYTNEFIVSSNDEYSTCIINISGLDQEIIKKEFIRINENKSSWYIDDILFVVVFGKKVDMQDELNRLKQDIKMLLMRKEIRKYNL